MENTNSHLNDWQNLNREELKSLLKDLKGVKMLLKDLGNKRGFKEFTKVNTGKSSYIVEYFPSMSQKDLESLSISIYSKAFNKNVPTDEIIFKENPELNGGLRIFSDYDMLDLSYKKIESFLLK
ncbi:MAG: hypothetical protein Q8K30_02725 [Candidatus Gracilibacteria bacterium]|nr:hypothetical protein [Candidatus Gracilibacteria bacterium]